MDGAERDTIENENRFEVRGDEIYWINEDVTFTKETDEYIDDPLSEGYFYTGDFSDDIDWDAEPFGLNFSRLVMTEETLSEASFYGFYIEDVENNGWYYPYEGGVFSYDTMDESDCAYLDLRMPGEESQFCYIEGGINNDIAWRICDVFGDEGGIEIENLETGELYQGDFWESPVEDVVYLRLFMGNNKLWMIEGPLLNIGGPRG
jgi:hypothetical protein